ncbi:fimbrial protein [Pantoea sp. NSTU24]|uniref:fimbrial protein n=1 Tax=Pantoea sp. NSTU24 TaxID=3391144 RepID=UPI003D00EF9A
MNKKLASKICLLSAVLMSSSAFAASTVTFQGEVTAQTCSISINSTTNATVLLPTIPLSALYTASTTTTAVGNSAGLTPFTISVTGCTSSGTALTMYPEFLGTSVDTTTFALGNTAGTNAATGVGIALYSDDTGTSQINLNGVTRGAALTLPANATSASTTYSAKYMATSATTTAGKVTGVAQYTLNYL